MLPKLDPIKETAIRLWKNDMPNQSIQINSTEWELYLVKAAEIEAQLTVFDTGVTSRLRQELHNIVKDGAILEKVWTVIMAYRGEFIKIVNENPGIKNVLKYLPENMWDDNNPELWNDDEDCLSEEGIRIYDFLKDYLCAGELGMDLYDDHG